MRKFLILILFSWGLLSTSASAGAEAGKVPDGSIVSNWLKAYEAFDLERFTEFYAAEVQFTDPTARLDLRSREQLKKTYRGIMQGRYGGDFKFDVERMVAQGSVTALEGLFSLTWNGQKATVHFTTWLEFRGGKIIRQLDMFDYGSLQRQIPTYGQGEPSEYTPE